MTRKPQRLSQPQFVALIDHLRARNGEPPYADGDEAARDISRRLGFQVTKANCKGAIEAIGLGYEDLVAHRLAGRRDRVPGDIEQRVALLESRLGLMASQLGITWNDDE